MGPEFVNIYIENLVKEMGELLKVKILLQTQLEMQQKITAELQVKIEALEKANADRVVKKKKEDNTF